jgi:hypothetical protein
MLTALATTAAVLVGAATGLALASAMPIMLGRVGEGAGPAQ